MAVPHCKVSLLLASNSVSQESGKFQGAAKTQSYGQGRVLSEEAFAVSLLEVILSKLGSIMTRDNLLYKAVESWRIEGVRVQC